MSYNMQFEAASPLAILGAVVPQRFAVVDRRRSVCGTAGGIPDKRPSVE
ncbi:MAG: hypothetical protein ACI8PT_002640 [Gammaproteobacteria bacterium]|jgi:hypothetical protein